MQIRKFEIVNGWLHFPIGRKADRYYVKFEADGQQFAELYLGLVTGEPDFWCGMELEKYIGKTVTVSVEEAGDNGGACLSGVPAGILNGILEGKAMGYGADGAEGSGGETAENPLYPDLYRETLRPQYHFSSRRGWLNDPNGLVFDGEKYHLYYQHNPYGITHGGVNVHWGHAVSVDGIHWKEHSDGIRPWVCSQHIASGSCIVDYDGIAGYGKGAVIAAFTHLGSQNFKDGTKENPMWYPGMGQYLAYSTDGGDSFTLFPECPLIPAEDGKDWRDPRIFADPDGGFGIAVYETTERGNCVSFYHSEDLHHWERTSRDDDLYECPDLFRLTPINGGAPKWVLYGADSKYRVGEFKNGIFTQEGERFPMDYGRCTYAGQTWNGRDDSDGRMHISWLRDESLSWDSTENYPGMPFSQQMTVPCLLKLVNTPDGYRLNRTPIPALNSLRLGEGTAIQMTAQKTALSLPLQSDTCLEIQCSAPVEVRIGNFSFVYDPQTGETVFDGGEKRFVLQKKGALNLRILTDTMSCEFFLQDEISASYGTEMRGKTVGFVSESSMCFEGRTYEMDSIWHGKKK